MIIFYFAVILTLNAIKDSPFYFKNMKKDIHPEYKEAKVSCACGNTFTVGSTKNEIKVELCSNCHPFYTGKQKLVDTAKRVEKFQSKLQSKEALSKARKGKKVKRAARAEKKAAEEK